MTTALTTLPPNETLVKPANPEEDVLSLISEMRRDNLTAKQIGYINEQRNRVFSFFRKIVYRQFGLSDEQILNLNDQRIETLFAMLVDKAQKSLWYQYPLHIFPVTLLIIYSINDLTDNSSDSGFKLIRAINKLRRAGDRAITGYDIRQNIENYDISYRGSLSKRSEMEKREMVERSKP